MDMSRLQATSLRIVRRMLRGAMWLAGLLLFAWAVGAVYYIEFFPWPVSGLFAIAYIKELLNRHPRANEVIVETTEILTPFPLCFSVPLWSHAFSHCRATCLEECATGFDSANHTLRTKKPGIRSLPGF